MNIRFIGLTEEQKETCNKLLYDNIKLPKEQDNPLEGEWSSKCSNLVFYVRSYEDCKKDVENFIIQFNSSHCYKNIVYCSADYEICSSEIDICNVLYNMGYVFKGILKSKDDKKYHCWKLETPEERSERNKKIKEYFRLLDES